jgi:AhpC/TSA family protein
VSDLQGNRVDPFTGKPAVAVTLVFVSNDCPISNRYVPELNRLYERFAAQGIVFWLVHADPSETSAIIRAHAQEYELRVPELRDPKHELVRMAQVAVTPSAAVFTPDGRLLYRGRIDDRFVALGRERPEAQRHDLAEALEAVVNHRPVAVAVTPAVGCYIPE